MLKRPRPISTSSGGFWNPSVEKMSEEIACFPSFNNIRSSKSPKSLNASWFKVLFLFFLPLTFSPRPIASMILESPSSCQLRQALSILTLNTSAKFAYNQTKIRQENYGNGLELRGRPIMTVHDLAVY